ncbi:hypothetical protein PW52_03570 [Tamlana sedimentorum]|uniref:Uncharacterized protein n=1 Tax=Neotamlana sedimentorum TaxID=1435349 RepID=A0A0D7WC20_9FLAO|nr:hypothetical protein [Tamlana sedimentorum]KJD36730.1 hypothetical protein PW52_03570 [Tamlana sedimentorum]
MKTANSEILTEIATLTRTIEDNYPELQKYLDESRSTLPKGNFNKGELDTEELENYRNSLKNLISKYNN